MLANLLDVIGIISALCGLLISLAATHRVWVLVQERQNGMLKQLGNFSEEEYKRNLTEHSSALEQHKEHQREDHRKTHIKVAELDKRLDEKDNQVVSLSERLAGQTAISHAQTEAITKQIEALTSSVDKLSEKTDKLLEKMAGI